MIKTGQSFYWVFIPTFVILFSLGLMLPQDSRGQGSTSDVGNFFPFLEDYSSGHQFSLSFLSEGWDVESWRTEAWSKLDELLAFYPESSSLNAEILDSKIRPGYTQYLVRYNLNAHQKTEAFLLVPDNLEALGPAVIAGFSSSYKQMLRRHLHHTWMMYVPRQYQFLDLPDVASLNAPSPLLISNAQRDHLFPLEGMKAADEKLRQIYTKMDSVGKFQANYYDVPHSMTILMQEDAFEWLEKWLK